MVQPYPTVFGVPEVDRGLDRKIAEYGIELRTHSELVSVDAAGRKASSGTSPPAPEELHYDVLNAVPPQSAPDWLKATDLPAPGDKAVSWKWTGRPSATSGTPTSGPWVTPRHHQFQIRRGAAQADQGSGQEPGGRPERKAAARRSTTATPSARSPFHATPWFRRVRRPIPAHAHHSAGAHLERKQGVLGGGPRHLPAGLLEPDPQGPGVGTPPDPARPSADTGTSPARHCRPATRPRGPRRSSPLPTGPCRTICPRGGPPAACPGAGRARRRQCSSSSSRASIRRRPSSPKPRSRTAAAASVRSPYPAPAVPWTSPLPPGRGPEAT